MIYRRFGNTDIKISQLGFGCMRFPLARYDDPAKIDEPKATRMLHFAIDNGVNYLDTAYAYHRGMSELFLGRALQKGYRNKVFLATKLPTWLVKKQEDLHKYFDEQLIRLQTDVIDMYLLHGLNKQSWKTVQEINVLKFLDDILSAGKIRFAGFSFHDELSVFKQIIDAYPWTFCLIHLNYVDDDYQAGIKGLEYAHDKGLAVVVMEPLRGGKLARNIPPEIIKIVKQINLDQTPAEFALRFLFDRSDVSCVLSGMSTIEHVEENIRLASQDYIGTLSSKDKALYSKIKEIYKLRTKVNCTGCGYCTPCPQKIAIPFILELYNDAHMYNAFEDSQWMYRTFIKTEHRVDKCVACAECEEKCPQKIPIVQILKKAHKLLAIDNWQQQAKKCYEK